MSSEALLSAASRATLGADASEAPRVLRVGLLGFGGVGRGLADLLAARRDDVAARHRFVFNVERVLVRDASRPREGLPAGATLCDTPSDFLSGRYDVVVEALGGIEPAAAIVAALLARGTSVITANKALLAERGDALTRIAAESGASLRFESAAAAGIPIFGVLENSLKASSIREFTAVLNATSNFVLTRVEKGRNWRDALEEARRRGFAEADSELDLSGIDAAQKVAVLTRTLTGRAIPVQSISRRDVRDVRPEDCARAAAIGHRLKPLSWASLAAGEGAWVGPAAVPITHPLAWATNEQNAILLTGEPFGELLFAGPGAGAGPTAQAIIDDLVAVGERRRAIAPRSIHDVPPARPGAGAAWRWFVTLVPSSRGPGAEKLLAHFASAGLIFLELRPVDEHGGRVYAGIVADAPESRLAALVETLRTVEAVSEARYFRAFAPRD